MLLESGVAPRRAALVTLLLVFATPLWPYSGFGFNQPLAGLFVWSAVLCALVAARRGQAMLVWSGACAGLALLTRHEMLLAAVLLAIWLALHPIGDRAGTLLRYLSGLAPAVVIWAALNWWRFGNPLESGYLRDATPGFGGSLARGTWGFLFSPYASIFLYCPLVGLSLPALRSMWRHTRNAAMVFTALFVAYFVLYASLGNWMGGRSYGPRYLVPFLPALILPIAFWNPRGWRGRLGLALAIVSISIQIPGVLVDYSKVREARAAAGATIAQDMRWSGMPLRLNLQAVRAAVPEAIQHVSGTAPRPQIRKDVPLSRALSSTLDLWWLHLFYLGAIGRGAAIALGTGLTAATVAALSRSLRLARQAAGRG